MQHKPAENIVGSEEVPEQVPAAVPTPESGVVDLAKLGTQFHLCVNVCKSVSLILIVSTVYANVLFSAKIQQKIQRDVFLFRLLLFPFAFFGLFIGNLAYKAKTGDKLDFGLLLLMYIVFCLTSLVCGVCFGCMYGGVLGLISPPTSSPPTLEQQGRGQAESELLFQIFNRLTQCMAHPVYSTLLFLSVLQRLLNVPSSLDCLAHFSEFSLPSSFTSQFRTKM